MTTGRDEQLDVEAIARDFATQSQRYLDTVTEIAAGEHDGANLSLLLLATTQALADGARLGAMHDVLPEEQFEPDNGPGPDFGPLLVALTRELEGLDEYADLVDPLTSAELTVGNLPGDLITVAEALSQGLQHYRNGAVAEALWWWQFSYLSDWGERAATAARVLLGVLSHVRLDADPEVIADAEFDALHR